MKWLQGTLLALLAMLVLAAVALWLYARQALPQTSGEMALPGLRDTVRIERDADGIPTVHAANLPDLAYGLGVLHAQDRLWQMETHKRIAAGRLAEAFGDAALNTDRFLRALGVRRAAQAQWAGLGAEAKQLLAAYTDGVNAVQHSLRARPPEFIILGLQTEDWTPIDSLAWATMMAWDLGGNWGTELQRLRLALRMPVERINELLPPYPGDKPMPTADYAALFRSLKLGSGAQAGSTQAWLQLPDIAPPSGVEGVGSNNWVVAGSHSSTGKPLLANDPHLKLSAPALWYFVRLEAPGFKVAGATLPGLPAVVLGQNENIAWGFTNTGPDVQDLYLEQIKPDDPAQYRTPDGWARFETLADTIKVKGRPDVPVTLRRTRHGPVISDAGIADDLLGAKPSHVLAMRWTALDADIDALTPALGFSRARSVAEFVTASRAFAAPMQNMVVADRDGHIGFVAPGRVPLRKPDNDLMGQVPSPGWDARYDWAGWVPADETPREFDPPRGFIATANQRVVAPGYPHYLTNDWALPYRHQRIEQVLQSRPRHSIDDLAALQADVKSLAAPKLLPWLLKASPNHPLLAAARQQLAGFDGTMAADSAAPLIFWAWLRQLTQAVFEDDLGQALWQRSGRSFRDALEGVLERDDTRWCDDSRTQPVETCAMQNDAALSRALDELQARHGADVTHWRWDAAHIARGEHRPFSRVKGLAGLFELRVPVGGDTTTVNVSKVSLVPDATTGELYLDEHGPSLRALYDVGDLRQSRVMHSSGQSGIVFSPLYSRFVKPWAEGRYVPLWASGPPAQTLLLKPAQTLP